MSHLKYSVYPGFGEYVRDNLGYSQAIRIGDRIECSGQGGWAMDAESGLSFPKKIADEIAQAFKNVDLNLRDAGGKGWSQVFRINSYHTDLTPEVTALMTENFRKWMPDHKPIWTQIGVKQLGVPDMNVELEVVAHDP
ncbi:hypothetical protein V2G26_011355 [Clonostachys chloroleuca]|uniref:Uncharacterized protein n=1 Tax=Clonostachys chloroleuca TaxID=1926264 RepID=A0AA35Q3Z0_9HYPO|nr:unnamed protein product [Clonostachys chloroleuca]